MTPNSSSVQVEEERGPNQTIARLGTSRTAFVGRTLRGPVNRPIFISSFTEFQHVFGGLWQPSPLGYAVEQFFDHGGREALIVRVVNGARSSTLTLKAGTAALRLRAVRPGTREYLRASVDYDNIAAEDTAEFNLTVQRVRAQGTAQVEDQEIFQRLSLLPSAEGYLPRAIAGFGADSAGRRDSGAAARSDLGCGQRLGQRLRQLEFRRRRWRAAHRLRFDRIGGRADAASLPCPTRAYFNFLCIPPLSRDQDVGPSALLVGARYCKERRALLIVDPPSSLAYGGRCLARHAGLEFLQRKRIDVLPSSAGARQAARPFRILRALRRRCRHVGALR